MNATTTQAQQFATAYAANMAEQMLKTVKRVRQAATVIMLIAMLVSYTHQAGYLAGIHTPFLGSWLIPGALDALTFLCVKVLGTPGMAQPAKTMAIKVLVFPVLASGLINFMGPGQLVTKLVFVVAVLMIPAAELVASRIKPDFQAMDEMERGMTPVAPIEDEPTASAATIRATQKRNAAAARKVAAESPALTPAQLAKATGVSRSTAAKILNDLAAVAPVSPGHGPVSAPSAAQVEEIVGTPAYI
jgi:hypothetical protein